MKEDDTTIVHSHDRNRNYKSNMEVWALGGEAVPASGRLPLKVWMFLIFNIYSLCD